MNSRFQFIAMVLSASIALPAMSQHSRVASVKSMPFDLTPRVQPSQCGDFQGHFGPFDYRTADPRDKRVVEEYHLDMELQTFLSGQLVGRNRSGTSAVIGGFNYVLKAMPNHPVALMVMEQYARKVKSDTPSGSDYPMECWYLRGFMIAPDDPVVRLMYGIFLANRGREAEALNNLKIADAATQSAPALQHQLGLAYIQIKQYRAAQLCALRLKRAKFPLDGVERQLREANKWDSALVLPAEPGATETAASAPETSASSPGQ